LNPNIFDNEFDEERDAGDGRSKRVTRIGAAAGAERIGATIWELDPGATAYKYHFHYGEEELLIVLEGTPSLRGPDGTRVLATGEVVSFRVGPQGAHQLINDSDRLARFIAISAGDETDIAIYPDTGQTLISHRRGKPGGFRQLLGDDA
jgi:uncharacterized cupin superfamily protein